MESRKILIGGLILNAIILGIIAFQLFKKNPIQSTPDIIVKNMEVLDSVNSIMKSVRSLENSVTNLKSTKETIIKLREPIIKNYYNEITQIDNAPDSVQLIILDRLLSKYDRIKESK